MPNEKSSWTTKEKPHLIVLQGYLRSKIGLRVFKNPRKCGTHQTPITLKGTLKNLVYTTISHRAKRYDMSCLLNHVVQVVVCSVVHPFFNQKNMPLRKLFFHPEIETETQRLVQQSLQLVWISQWGWVVGTWPDVAVCTEPGSRYSKLSHLLLSSEEGGDLVYRNWVSNQSKNVGRLLFEPGKCPLQKPKRAMEDNMPYNAALRM